MHYNVTVRSCSVATVYLYKDMGPAFKNDQCHFTMGSAKWKDTSTKINTTFNFKFQTNNR